MAQSDSRQKLYPNEVYEALFENATEGIIVSDQAGEILMANPSACRLFGYQQGELVGLSIEDLVPERHRSMHKSYRSDYFQEPSTRPMGKGMDLTGQRKDGSEFPVEISLSYFEVEGKLYAVSYLIDISERRKKTVALQKEKEKAQSYLDLAGSMFVALDREGTVEMANKRAQEILDYPEEEIIGKNWFEYFIPQRIRESTKEVFQQLIEGEGQDVKQFENPVLTSNGEERVIAFQNRIVRDVDDTIIGILSSGDDITERLETQRQLKRANRELRRYARDLERSNKELEQFAYVASHDLKEPLRMVTSYTQLLARRYKEQLNEEAQEFINYAVDGAKRMEDLINDLLQYSRVGRKSKDFEKVNLKRAVEGARENLAYLIKEMEARIEIEGDLPTVTGNRTLLTQLFQNLFSNAIKFRKEEEHPVVTVKCTEKDTGHWQISVTDNGIGIPEKQKDRIFMIFQRLHTRDEYEGSGIGLALCRKIVDHMEGRIRFESEVGKGTTFYITLPKTLNEPV